MNESKLDIELISAITLEITDRYKLLLKLIPKELGEERFLRHLAASSIHMAMFTRDLRFYVEGKEMYIDKSEDKFLAECGCDMKEKI